MTHEERLAHLGITLPSVPFPVAQYVPAVQVGDLVYVSGQGPVSGGRPKFVGRVGGEISLEEGYQAARLCALNGLAATKALLGTLDRVARVVHVRGFVNSTPCFLQQSQVIDGASDLLVSVFGDAGRHARAALGANVLPGNIPVEVEMILCTDPASISESPKR